MPRHHPLHTTIRSISRGQLTLLWHCFGQPYRNSPNSTHHCPIYPSGKRRFAGAPRSGMTAALMPHMMRPQRRARSDAHEPTARPAYPATSSSNTPFPFRDTPQPLTFYVVFGGPMSSLNPSPAVSFQGTLPEGNPTAHGMARVSSERIMRPPSISGVPDLPTPSGTSTSAASRPSLASPINIFTSDELPVASKPRKPRAPRKPSFAPEQRWKDGPSSLRPKCFKLLARGRGWSIVQVVSSTPRRRRNGPSVLRLDQLQDRTKLIN